VIELELDELLLLEELDDDELELLLGELELEPLVDESSAVTFFHTFFWWPY